jgi:hypothetical protein
MTRTRRAALAAVVLIAAAAAILLAMGRHPVCTCGTIELWVGGRDSPKTSQMLADWYSFSHVVHGLLFYAALWLVARNRPLEWRFLAALLVETAWEIIENTPLVIDRYRTATAALGYSGDSVINSVSDILAMVVGFALAARLPVRIAVVLAVAIELLLAYWIRDNLTLNILMLIYPLDVVRRWQETG